MAYTLELYVTANVRLQERTMNRKETYTTHCLFAQINSTYFNTHVDNLCELNQSFTIHN